LFVRLFHFLMPLDPPGLNVTRLIIFTLALSFAWMPADAAEPEKSPNAVRLTDSGNRVIYRSRYFDFENVSNLEQLLDQIPDLQHEFDDSLRGTGFRVLINGNVVGSAPRDLKDIGRQFSLEDIKRIAILRGPAALEYAGIPGPAINIVLKANADRSVARWEASTLLGHKTHDAPNVRFNYGNPSGDWAYELFTAYLPNDEYRPRTRNEVYLDPVTLQPTQRRQTTYDENIEQYVLGGSVKRQVNDKLILRANTRLSEHRKDRIQARRIDGAETPTLTKLEDDRDLGEFDLAAVVQLSPTSLWESRFRIIDETRDQVVATGQAGAETLLLSSATRHEDRRTALSSVISRAAESGSESSLAFYGTQRRRDALSAAGLAELELQSEAKISENRFDLVAHYGWQPQPEIGVFTSLDIEYWRLKQQNGPFFRRDDEIFVKPALDFRWRFAAGSLLRLSSKRQVRNLNFNHLVFKVDLDDETVDIGNLSMVPESSWLSTLFVERRVLDNTGRLRLGGFYRDIEDYIERVPAPGGGSGPGNVGDAHASGIQLTGRLQWLKNPVVSTVIKADFTLQDSEVTDPFTGRKRPLRAFPDKLAKLELRQEFPHASVDYVLDATWQSDTWYSEHNYRESRSMNRPIVNLKANYQATDNVQFWFEVRGLFDLDESRWREKYKGDAELGQISRYEQSEFLENRQYTVGLLGYF
jgi:hypothetical protein